MTGVLLVNLGTPSSPSVKDVRSFLKEFLSDPYVIDIPTPLRLALLYGFILPFRPKNSAAQYEKIWTKQGSPLMFHSQKLLEKLGQSIGDQYALSLGMRYGKPSIEFAIKCLLKKKITKIIALPLYPQYSLAATESSIEAIRKAHKKLAPETPLEIFPPFYKHPAFIRAFEKTCRPIIDKHKFDHFLFSFHGLPERQIQKASPNSQACLQSTSCCDQISEDNQNCYRAQSFETSRLLAKALGIREDKYTVCFQSRLGRTPWISPYTDKILEQLPKQGSQLVGVIEPSFVADCLETLEEIAIRGQQTFTEAGGTELTLFPSLNSNPHWVEALTEMIHQADQS